MQCLTPSESAAWLRAHRIPALLENETPCVIGDYEVFSETPKSAKAMRRLARDLVSWLGDFETCLFWLTDWPFHEEDEMELVSFMRERHGEHRLLIEAPGHVFASTERHELTRWVFMTMGFGWDGYLFTSPFRGSMLQTSHEDFVWLLSAGLERFVQARSIVRRHGLKIHRESPIF